MATPSENDTQSAPPFPETYLLDTLPPGPRRSLVGKRHTPSYMLGWVIDRRFAYDVLSLNDPDTSLEHFVRTELTYRWCKAGLGDKFHISPYPVIMPDDEMPMFINKVLVGFAFNYNKEKIALAFQPGFLEAAKELMGGGVGDPEWHRVRINQC